ncbi:Lrp/AsnC family transcriptional regulator [Rhodococcus aerolatus]
MDGTDQRILAELRRNGRVSIAELSRTVGLSSSALTDRVAKLEQAGVVTGYTATVDPRLVGLGVAALVGVEPSDTGDDEAIARDLSEHAEVESLWTVAGQEAFVLLVRVPTVDELQRLLVRLRRVDGVARTRTTVVLSTLFEGRPQPGPSPEPG